MLSVEIKGYRGEDAKDKKSTMEIYWAPGINLLRTYSRWDFSEFADAFRIAGDFAKKVADQLDQMIAGQLKWPRPFRARPPRG